MKKTDLTMYPVKNQIQLIKLNHKIQRAMVEAKTWEQLRSTITSMVDATEDALKFFETKYKNN
jgi:hypothetical protein